MRVHRVAVIPGDGIGREVVPAALQVLETAARYDGGFRLETVEFPWSCEYYLQHGRMMPADGIKQLADFEAILLGAVGFPSLVPDHISLWGLMLPIRKEFDLYANIRPCRLLPGLQGPLRDKGPAEIDIYCIRENTEGEYSGAGGRVHVGTSHEVAVQTTIFTRHATERIIRFAFEEARRLGRRQVTSVTKSNAQQHSAVFWDEVFEAVGAQYPDLARNQLHVDAAAARFVTHPETLDVVVASNLFADILTDLGGALVGSLGVPPSANINPDRRNVPGLFEPVHGSAPDIFGRRIANPIATVWAGAMMLDFLGERAASAAVIRAIEAVTASRDPARLTPDLGGTATTDQAAAAIRSMLR